MRTKFYSIKVSNICEKAQILSKIRKMWNLLRRIWTSLFLRFHRFLLLLFSQTNFYWPSAVAPLIPIIYPSFLLSLSIFPKILKFIEREKSLKLENGFGGFGKKADDGAPLARKFACNKRRRSQKMPEGCSKCAFGS